MLETPGSLLVIIVRKESVSQKVHGLLSQLGEVEDARDHQSNEHERQHHIPHCGKDIVAPGFGAVAMGSFQVTGHLLIPCLPERRRKRHRALVRLHRKKAMGKGNPLCRAEQDN